MCKHISFSSLSHLPWGQTDCFPKAHEQVFEMLVPLGIELEVGEGGQIGDSADTLLIGIRGNMKA